MKILKKIIQLTAVCTLLTSYQANAHTVSIGFENAGLGQVTFWFGTYHVQTESPRFEGNLNLVGDSIIFSSLGNAFAVDTAMKPTGLIDGTTNFYASGGFFGAGPLVNTNTLSLPVRTWQGVTIGGLSPGTYTFSYGILPTNVKWAPWNPAVTSSQVTLSGAVVGNGNNVPDGGTTVAMLGLGFLGLVGMRRRFAK